MERFNLEPERIRAMQERFTRCITDGSGTEGLLRVLSELTERHAVYEGSGLTALLFVSSEAERLYAAGDRYKGQQVFRASRAVTADGRKLGTLSLLSTSVLCEQEHDAILELASDFLAIQLTMDKKISEIELRLSGNFAEDLILGNYLDSDSILSRAKALSFNAALPHRVLVAELPGAEQAARTLSRDQNAFRAELVKKVQSILNLSAGGLAAYKGNELIVFMRQMTQGDDFEPANRLAETLIEETEQSFKLKMFIGIGDVCVELEDYKNAYMTAKKALEIGEFMITEGQVRSFERFKIHALFLSTLKPDELQKYAKSQLSELMEYDAVHKTELLKTLQEHLYLRNNIEGTAKSLNMSVSGLKYRLKQIERIIGKELRDNKVGFDLQLALIILQMFGEYRI